MPAPQRITVSAHGYRWLVHGGTKVGRFQTHLVELLGNERLDIPLTPNLSRELREAVAEFLNVELLTVNPITPDLILLNNRGG